jgi:hypothetical protein
MYIESYHQNTAIEGCIQFSTNIQSKSHVQLKSENTSTVDQNVTELSSVKLLSVLRLSSIAGCELEDDFIQSVKQELMLRKHDTVWLQPH